MLEAVEYLDDVFLFGGLIWFFLTGDLLVSGVAFGIGVLLHLVFHGGV